MDLNKNITVANLIFNPSVAVGDTIDVLPVISIVVLLGSSSSSLAQRLCSVQTTLILHTSAAQAFYSSPNSVDQAPIVVADFNASVYANVYYSNTMILLPHTPQVISLKLSYTNYLYWRIL